jgi:outer membrane protein TolC
MGKVLGEIEANNTTLVALKQQIEVQKTGSRTGIYLPNPEVEFNYLWGSPSDLGDRKDLNIMQSFDFPTAYYYKRQIADGKASQADLQYAAQRKSILLQARGICINLVYRNALKSELDSRLAHAQSIARAYQAKYDKGEANILEQNKAQLNLLNAQKEVENNDIEHTALLAELARMNGGKAISLTDAAYQTYPLASDFDQWYATAEINNPALQHLSQEIEISHRQEQLNKAMSLPKFSAGYRSERVLGTTFQGIGAGISIPLWENKNTVKHAKAQTLALQNTQTDAKMQFYNSLKTQYTKAQGLQRMAADYRRVLQTVNSSDLLQKALDKGQISFIEYVMEQALYYDAVNRVLEVERDQQHAVAELRQWEN